MTQSSESNALLSLFVSRVSNRLQRGAATYGDSSFDKPLATTSDEILQELEDVAGWAAIAWVRIKKQLTWVDESAKGLGLSEGPLAGASTDDSIPLKRRETTLKWPCPEDHSVEVFGAPDLENVTLVGSPSGTTLVFKRQEKPQDVASEVAHDRRCHSNHSADDGA